MILSFPIVILVISEILVVLVIIVIIVTLVALVVLVIVDHQQGLLRIQVPPPAMPSYTMWGCGG